ncbi:hypothetical protein [Streptomyces sp. 8N616]|uniref:hypothetical protein n=1 Tax=Streptomyces sp. 8N616 TaxID=3457414 RepID=UPI003FCFCD09
MALITACSTLLGGGLAAFAAAWSSSRQLNSQEKLAGQSRDEQREACRRQLRRDAYVGFLNQLDATNRAMWEVWTHPLPSDHQPVIDSLYSMMWQLGEASNIIMLEGPEDVAAAAEDAIRCCWERMGDLARASASAVERDRSTDLSALFPYEWERFARQGREVHTRFLAQASAVIGAAMQAVIERRMADGGEPRH